MAVAEKERQNRILYDESARKVTPLVRGAFGAGLIGGSGVDIQAGIFAEEYLTTLRGDKKVKAFAEMLNDPAVAKEIRIVSMPILTAEVRFEPPDDDPTPDEIDAADLCNANLLRRPSAKYGAEHFITTPWRQRLGEILASLEHGASVFHRDRDHVRGSDKTIFSRLRYIFPYSIKRYFVHEDDEWRGIRQEWFVPGTGRYLRHDIEPERLAIYPWQIRGILYEGVPWVRPMWKPWSIKNIVEKLEVINAQRQAAPPPDYEYSSANPDPEEVEASKDMLEALRQGPTERTYVRRPHGSKLGYLQQSTASPTEPIIKAKTIDIARAGAGQGTELGTSSAGSRATAEQLLAQTTLLQNAVASWIADIESEGIAGQPGLAQELTEMNYPPGTRHPRMVFGNVDKDGALKHVPVVTKAFADGFLTKTPNDEAHLRKITGWIALDEKQAEEARAKKEAEDERRRALEDRRLAAGIPPGDDNGSGSGNGQPRPRPKPRNRVPKAPTNADLQRDLADVGADAIRMEVAALKELPSGGSLGVERRVRKGRREPTPFERAVADFGGIAADLGSVEEQYLTRMQTAVLRATADVSNRIRSGELTVDQAMAGDIPLKHQNELKQQLESVMVRAFRIGRNKAADMIDRQAVLAGDKPTGAPRKDLANTGTDRLSRQADVDVFRIFEEMLASFMREVQNGDAQGLVPEQIADLLEANMPRAAGATSRSMAARSATTAFNEGELDIISDRLDEVQFVVRSELRDDNTCEPCNELDGMKLDVADPDFREFIPPAKCDGEKLCRGILIPVRS